MHALFICIDLRQNDHKLGLHAQLVKVNDLKREAVIRFMSQLQVELGFFLRRLFTNLVLLLQSFASIVTLNRRRSCFRESYACPRFLRQKRLRLR